jgi:hypothetical protein
VTRILGPAIAALTLAFAAPSYAQVTGTNSAVQDNFQTIEQFRAKWNNLLDRAKGRTDIQHSCQEGLCVWNWELRPHVWAKMVESNNGAGQAWYCFLAEPATTWDCYGNTLQKWVWNPTGDTAVASAEPGSAPDPVYTPAPAVTTNDAVPIFTDGLQARVSAMIGSISAPMLIDTGATIASVNYSVAQALLASGEAVEDGRAEIGLAGGQTVTADHIVIHRIAVGTHVATEVPAIINTHDADMLLSLPALNQMGKFTIDMTSGQLIFG